MKKTYKKKVSFKSADDRWRDLSKAAKMTIKELHQNNVFVVDANIKQEILDLIQFDWENSLNKFGLDVANFGQRRNYK